MSLAIRHGAMQSPQASLTPELYEMFFALYRGQGHHAVAQRVRMLELRLTTSGIPVVNQVEPHIDGKLSMPTRS